MQEVPTHQLANRDFHYAPVEWYWVKFHVTDIAGLTKALTYDCPFFEQILYANPYI